MQDSFFRELSDEEKAQFIQWAQDNFVPGMAINPLWHPVIKDEIDRLQAGYLGKCRADEVETPLGEALDGGYDYDADYNEYDDDSFNAQYDDDPSPYSGDYSED